VSLAKKTDLELFPTILVRSFI